MAEDADSTLRLPAATGATAASPGRPPGGRVEPLEGRGRTEIADRVLERLAARFALEVPGVVRHSSGPPLGGLGEHLPDASAESAGERVRVKLRLAVRWETPAHEVAAAVREDVRRRLTAATGKSVDRVDVVVGALLPSSRVPEDTGRRVQ
ncbi:Asp23/Gls24 family envelope stress response protein [Actinotalea sp. Marseille-Q4924]|uniref:Asp23/Gls24 family envelope stress response protein n=1 Tax=Actinotalea sp. Marseille-Q4924 TaxID=2866571 RepID=UPI001CE48547|nr:Asp23/Gls24 family envelope stress response protein [Actinotalea sp. Marseille-Q4924]